MKSMQVLRSPPHLWVEIPLVLSYPSPARTSSTTSASNGQGAYSASWLWYFPAFLSSSSSKANTSVRNRHLLRKRPSKRAIRKNVAGQLSRKGVKVLVALPARPDPLHRLLGGNDTCKMSSACNVVGLGICDSRREVRLNFQTSKAIFSIAAGKDAKREDVD